MTEVTLPQPAVLPASTTVVHPTPLELFLGFANIALIGFGGVLAFSRQVIVDRRRWMTGAEFDETLEVVLFLPGPTTANIGIVYGQRLHGLRGALAALAGILAPPMAVVIVLTILYQRFGTIPIARALIAGMTPAAAGLLLAVGLHMAAPHVRTRDPRMLVIGALALVAVGVFRLPLLIVVAVLAPLSILGAWRAAR